MSITALTQAYDEVRRLAIAGSVVAPGDFRLKKLLPQLEAAGKKAPVFARVAEAVTRLVDSSERTSAAPLLELAALVHAILYTQGETGIDGELTPLETIELGRPRTQASARMLKPLLEALTTTGSGRLEVIRDAFERGAFHDLRLIAPSLAALDDTYSEIGDLVAQRILPLYGRAILPELQATFDAKGRSGHVRRLVLMHRLDPEATRPIVQVSLEEGTQEVRIAAIGCLGESPDDLPFLLEQVKSKAKDVRAAALAALGSSGSANAAKVLCDVISSADLGLAVEPLRTCRNAAVTTALHEAAQLQLEALLTGREKDAKRLGRQNERMCLILDCLPGRDDQRTEGLLLEMFAHREQLARIKGEPSGKDVVERLVTVMAAGPQRVRSALVDAHASLSADSFGHAFLAACRSHPPAEVFKRFSPYLTAKVNEKRKARDPAWVNRETIVRLLGRMGWHTAEAESAQDHFDIRANLDPRWLDLAVKLGRADLVQALAIPGHKQANAFLGKLLQERLRKSKDDHELLGILSSMIRVGHAEATDGTIAVIQNNTKSTSHYAGYWISHLIPRLPRAEALPKLEALLPTLPEHMIDQLLEAVTALKNSSSSRSDGGE